MSKSRKLRGIISTDSHTVWLTWSRMTWKLVELPKPIVTSFPSTNPANCAWVSLTSTWEKGILPSSWTTIVDPVVSQPLIVKYPKNVSRCLWKCVFFSEVQPPIPISCNHRWSRQWRNEEILCMRRCLAHCERPKMLRNSKWEAFTLFFRYRMLERSLKQGGW